MDNKKWTNKKEKLLLKWKEECKLYSWLFNYNTKYYDKLDKIISIPSILITGITGTTLFSTLNLDNKDEIIIVLGVLLIIGTILQSIRDFLNLKHLINKNQNCVKLYNSIISDIEEQLGQEIIDRECGNDFLKKIKMRKTDIFNMSPNILDKSWSELIKNIKERKIFDVTSLFHELEMNDIHQDKIDDILTGLNNESQAITITSNSQDRRLSEIEFESISNDDLIRKLNYQLGR